MRRYAAISLLLYSTCIAETSAWVTPVTHVAIIQQTTPTFRAAVPTTTESSDTQGQCSSRRQWFAQVTTSAVIALSTGSSANAVVAAEKPVAPSLCDSAVSVWQKGSRRVTLLGTAHISTLSAELAGQLVRDIRPDAVFVELDAKRVGRAGGNIVIGSSAASASAARRAGSNDALAPANAVPAGVSSVVPSSVIVATSSPTMEETMTMTEQPAPPRGIGQRLRERALEAGSAAVGNAIRSLYSKLNSSGFNAGEEFIVAVREGQKIGAAIVLGDRDVEVTLRRLTEALAQTDLKELMSPDSELETSMRELMPGPPPSQDMSDADFRQEMSIYVETMKAKENVRKIMGQLKKAAPLIYQALVEERDVYMANALNSLNQFSNIVAVMGIAHMEGVENTLHSLGWEQVPLKCPKK